jgi:outer membrane lipoprotein SlyB
MSAPAKPAVPALRRLLLPAVLLALAVLGLAACSGSYSPNTYAAAAAQQANPVTRGVIIGERPVMISPSGTVGAVAGGAAGGVAGSQTPGGTIASAFGAIGGSLLGGLAGSATERAVDDTKAWEYIVQQKDGKLVSITQTDRKPLAIGTHVLVIAGKQARVVQDYTVAPPTKATAETEPTPAPIVVMPLPTPAVATDPPSPGASGTPPPAATDPAASPSP